MPLEPLWIEDRGHNDMPGDVTLTYVTNAVHQMAAMVTVRNLPEGVEEGEGSAVDHGGATHPAHMPSMDCGCGRNASSESAEKEGCTIS